jgi:Asp-tRNA(Asn)/Glu-tRNA(Gln) amidotransferase A subunit family amidase
MREHLHKGTFTSEDLVHVFGYRCYTIGRELCLTAEENIEEALEMAKIKDIELKKARADGTLKKLPFFHGIPISIKDLV